ncbi:hypothetical protein AN696_0208005 [Enterobacter asburiae]|uniref:Uncharacterized protein n=1 Tax=Enterobacter asburiae TaxID=61645 RepID=A0AB36FL25_ENTAS|nr:hypothetical protein AN696_0208005 [Enterobacter asburiae]
MSLRLFLFLNATSAVFSVTNPLNSVRLLSAPLIAIFSISTGLFVWHWRKRARKINIPVVSGIFGILWAWQIVSKFGNDSNLLIVFYVQIMPDDFVMQLHRF